MIEGTVLSEDTRAQSKAYAKKMNILFEAEHLILPKTTGIFHILQSLQNAEYLYDFTIGYSGLDGKMTPQLVYPPSKVFLEGSGPKSIHIHVERFKRLEIPGIRSGPYDSEEMVSKEFETWLYNRYLQKDALLKDFYANGTFPETTRVGSGLRQKMHVTPEFTDWLSVVALVVASFTSCSWALFG